MIDERKGALYLDAMVDGDKGPRHLVFGLSLADGAVLPGWPVDTANTLQAIGMTFNAPAQGERGALTLAGDKLYVPYGGHFGECGNYRGWVVGLNLDKPAAFAAWRTPVKMAGIWAPGGIAFDGHHLFAAVGHTLNDSEQWNGANSVIRLPPDLNWRPKSADFFAPADWFELNRRYYVLAYNNPLAIDLPDGGPGSALLFALDKHGKAYLLDRANLGGVGHPLLAQQVVELGLIANTSPAAWRMERNMMVALAAFTSTFPGAAVGGGRDRAEHLGRGATGDQDCLARQSLRAGSPDRHDERRPGPTLSSGSSARRAIKSCTGSAAILGKRFSRAASWTVSGITSRSWPPRVGSILRATVGFSRSAPRPEVALEPMLQKTQRPREAVLWRPNRGLSAREREGGLDERRRAGVSHHYALDGEPCLGPRFRRHVTRDPDPHLHRARFQQHLDAGVVAEKGDPRNLRLDGAETGDRLETDLFGAHHDFDRPVRAGPRELQSSQRTGRETRGRCPG